MCIRDRFVLTGRADAAGNLQGVAVERGATERGRTLRIHPAARMRGLEGVQAAFLDAALAAVPVTAVDAGGREAAQLLVVYVQRQPDSGGIGGRLSYRYAPAELPQAPIEFVLVVAGAGAAWAAADPTVGDRGLRNLIAAETGRGTR
eukprot:2791204-Alexandrium_andersonii.AAC.1